VLDGLVEIAVPGSDLTDEVESLRRFAVDLESE
jgi:hypothetical protein